MKINKNLKNNDKGNKKQGIKIKNLNKSHYIPLFNDNININNNFVNLNLKESNYNTNTYNDDNAFLFNNINNETYINTNINNIISKYNFPLSSKKYQNKTNNIGQRRIKNNLQKLNNNNI